MDVILSSVKWKFALVYQHDFLMSSKTFKKHIDHVPKVFLLLYSAEATLKHMKCNFFADIISYLGHVTVRRRLKLASHTTDAICGHKLPASLTRLRSILGICIVYTRFVPSVVRIVSPLRQLLKKKQPKTFALLVSKEL